MTNTDVHGPVDFVLIEFSGDRLTGRTAEALLDLVERGVVRVYDILMIGKDDDGSIFAIDIAESATRRSAASPTLAGARSGPPLGRRHARGGRSHGAGHPGRADHLREHLGHPVRSGGDGGRRRAHRQRPNPGTGRHGRARRPGQIDTRKPAAEETDHARTAARSRTHCRRRRHRDRGERTRAAPPGREVRRAATPRSTRTANRPTRSRPPRTGSDAGAALSHSTDDTLDQLQRLGELKAQGVLTEEEFAAQKAKILGG